MSYELHLMLNFVFTMENVFFEKETRIYEYVCICNSKVHERILLVDVETPLEHVQREIGIHNNNSHSQ